MSDVDCYSFTICLINVHGEYFRNPLKYSYKLYHSSECWHFRWHCFQSETLIPELSIQVLNYCTWHPVPSFWKPSLQCMSSALNQILAQPRALYLENFEDNKTTMQACTLFQKLECGFWKSFWNSKKHLRKKKSVFQNLPQDYTEWIISWAVPKTELIMWNQGLNENFNSTKVLTPWFFWEFQSLIPNVVSFQPLTGSL